MEPKLLLLVRHADSEKNALGQFSGNHMSDRLTDRGTDQLEQLSREIEIILQKCQIQSIGLAHADSERAKTTAHALRRFSSEAPLAVAGFRSIRSGIAAGLTETKIAERYPVFSRALHLYRTGVLSSYEIPYPQGAEPVVDFEAEVIAALEKVLTGSRQLQVIVAHRSSITAMLLHYARLAHKYPRNFFGFIPLDAGVTSCIDIRNGSERILWVNRSVDATLLDAYAR